MKRTLLALLTALSIQIGWAQTVHQDFMLSKDPVYVDTVKVGDANTVILEETKSNEYAFYQDNFSLYTLLHRRIRVATDKGMEQSNKVYIQVGGEAALLNYSARVIKPDGKVITLGKDALKEGEDEETGGVYNYFAFEGLEKGSDIEYFYYVRRPAMGYNGRAIFVQGNVDKYNSTTELISPWNLEFAFKEYNGLTEIKEDTALENKNRYFVHYDYLKGFKKQESAFEEPNKKYFVYKLDKNLSNGTRDLVSYGEITSNLYKYIYTLDKKQLKIVKKIDKEIDKDESTTEAKIRSIENHMKTNFQMFDNANPVLFDVESIYENKAYNKQGATKMFVALLKANKIKHELVITCDRTYTPFDEEFEAYNFLGEYFVYFPDLGLYMDPASAIYRLGYIDYEYMNTYGLFIKEKTIGDLSTGVGKIKRIKPLGADKTTHNLFVDVKFDAELSEPEYKFRQEATGYYAILQSYYDFVKEEEDKESLSKSNIENIDKEGEIVDLEVENEGANNFGAKPYIVKAKLESDKFLEVAGNKYLFKLGDLIGPQMELYQEEERVLPVQSEYNRSYHREIRFNIPEGYKIANIDDIVIKETLELEGKTEMAFISTFKVEGNEVFVNVDEYYKLVDLAKEQYPTYQKVINAAADFNKIVLIFEPI